MRATKTLILACLFAVIGSCVIAPISDTPPARRHSPPPSAERSVVRISDLEASPVIFMVIKPIDFVVRIQNRGTSAASGFDVGIFHEGRLVAWEMNKGLNPGTNVFRVRDNGFVGEPGNYIVRVRRAGRIIDEKAFTTYRKGMTGLYTLDPSNL